MKVFVVDDDGPSRRFITWLLTLRTRHEVYGFANGEAALFELAVRPPAILLSDLDLPGVSGEDLARAAATLVEPPHVVLMSADRERLEAARPLSARLLPKPFGISDLLQALERPAPSALTKEEEQG